MMKKLLKTLTFNIIVTSVNAFGCWNGWYCQFCKNFHDTTDNCSRFISKCSEEARNGIRTTAACKFCNKIHKDWREEFCPPCELFKMAHLCQLILEKHKDLNLVSILNLEDLNEIEKCSEEKLPRMIDLLKKHDINFLTLVEILSPHLDLIDLHQLRTFIPKGAAAERECIDQLREERRRFDQLIKKKGAFLDMVNLDLSYDDLLFLRNYVYYYYDEYDYYHLFDCARTKYDFNPLIDVLMENKTMKDKINLLLINDELTKDKLIEIRDKFIRVMNKDKIDSLINDEFMKDELVRIRDKFIKDELIKNKINELIESKIKLEKRHCTIL